MLQLLATVVNSCTTSLDGVQTCSQSNVNTGGFLAAMASLWVFFFAIYIFMAVVQWKIFTKAGKPGWASLIPIYSTVNLLQIVGKPDWWVILFLVPFVNLVVSCILAIELAKSFGKSTGFGVVGLILFPLVGYPMLGFGSSTYKGPGGNGAPATPAPALGPQPAPVPAVTTAPPAVPSSPAPDSNETAPPSNPVGQ